MRDDKIAQGWLGEPPAEQECTPSSHEFKWYKMMGATHLIPSWSPERTRFDRYVEEVQAEQEHLNTLMPPTVIGLGLGLPLAQRYRRERTERD